MEITLTDDVKKAVTDRVTYKAKNAKTEYFVAEAMGDARSMEFWKSEYEKAMNWLIANKLA